MPDAFTINVGDVMMWWTNGYFLSNFHRVKNRSGAERFSIPFFTNPDRNVVVAPLPELLEKTGAPRFAPVRISDMLNRFYTRQRARAE